MSNNRFNFKPGDEVMWLAKVGIKYGRIVTLTEHELTCYMDNWQWSMSVNTAFPAVRVGSRWRDVSGWGHIVSDVKKAVIYYYNEDGDLHFHTWREWFQWHYRATGCEGGCCSWRNTNTGAVECINCDQKFEDPLPPSLGAPVAQTSYMTQTPPAKHGHVKSDVCKYANGVKIEGTDRTWHRQDHRTEVYGPVAREREFQLIDAGRSVVYRTHRVWPQCPVTGQPILVAPHMKDDLSGYAVLRCFCC